MKFLSNSGLAYLITKLTGIGFVVETGNANGWGYRKWNSGVAECWQHTSAASTAMTQTSGTGYYTSYSGWNFPSGLFISAPTVTIKTKSAQGLINACCYFINKDYMSFFVYCTVSTTQNIEFMNYAIGYWK